MASRVVVTRRASGFVVARFWSTWPRFVSDFWEPGPLAPSVPLIAAQVEPTRAAASGTAAPHALSLARSPLPDDADGSSPSSKNPHARAPPGSIDLPPPPLLLLLLSRRTQGARVIATPGVGVGLQSTHTHETHRAPSRSPVTAHSRQRSLASVVVAPYLFFALALALALALAVTATTLAARRMSGTRPIPISNRSRASPPNSSSSRGGSPLDHAIAHSCPVHVQNGHVPGASGASYSRFQPPRAPFFGSLPEPSFLQIDDNPMPELLLPPPVHSRNNSPAQPSVAQFASSCPVDIGFMRQGHPAQHSWAPSPRALDEFDLSKSPALAVMSAAREGRVPAHNFRRVGQQQQQQSPHHATRTRHHRSSSSGARGSYSESAGLYTELMGNLSITEEEHSSFSDDSADYNHHQTQPSHCRPDDAFARTARERRGSYGSLSDTGDSGVFDFEEN